MKITHWKERFWKGISFMVGGFLLSILLDYFWSDLSWQESVFRMSSLIRLVVFFVVGFFMKTKNDVKKQ